jgi:hypothetical protein
MRQQIDMTALTALVVAEIDKKVQAGEEFTAYDITLAARKANPDAEIIHDEVRAAVRDHMNSVASYTPGMKDFAGVAAISWGPAPAPAPATGILARIGALIPWGKK